VYDQITQGERFVYTMLDGRETEVIFNAIDYQTEVIITFDAEAENSLELQQNGWQAILNNYKKYTEL
ncbi:MAG: activator of HSP90 ATPase, partial [Salibacteraceae bacterium]|nr:activator of HSP90 ATPase [Salibacteraceae bacterium]